MTESRPDSTGDPQTNRLKLIPERESLPASGYESAGSSLHSHLHGTSLSGLADKLRQFLKFVAATAFCFSAVGIIVIIVIISGLNTAPAVLYQRAPRFVLGTIGLLLLGGLSMIIDRYIYQQYLSAQLESAMTLSCLVDDKNAPVITVDGPDDAQLKPIFEMVGPSYQIKEVNQSTTDLVDQLPDTPADESFHIAEFSIIEEKDTDSYATDKSTMLGEGDATHLPLDEVLRRLRNHPSPMMLQFVITPRNIQDDIDERKKDIRHERDYVRVSRVLNAVFDSTDSLKSDGRDAEDLTGDAYRRYQDLDRTKGRKAFLINLRAIAVGHPDAADTGFDLIRTVIDETLTEFVSVTYDSYTAPAVEETNWTSPWEDKKRVWEGILNQTPWQRENFSLLRTHKPAFVADSETLWKYLLVSTESGTGKQWDQGASPKDTQPTDTPASDEYSEYQWDGSFDDLVGESQFSSESEE